MSQQYTPSQAQRAPQNSGNGFGVAALVLGILAVVAAFIPILGLVAFILGPLAIILGIVGVTRKFKPRGTSITGIILGIVSIIIAAIITALVAGTVAAIDESINSTPSASDSAAPSSEASAGESTAPAGTNTVTYEVTSDGPTASSVTYATFDNGGMGQEQANDAALPFAEVVDLGENEMFETNIFSLTAQAAQGATTISCRITANSEVISEQTSTGEFAVVSCSGTPD